VCSSDLPKTPKPQFEIDLRIIIIINVLASPVRPDSTFSLADRKLL